MSTVFEQPADMANPLRYLNIEGKIWSKKDRAKNGTEKTDYMSGKGYRNQI